MSKSSTQDVHDQKKKGGKIALATGGAVLVIGAVGLAFVLGRNSSGDEPDEPPAETSQVRENAGHGTILGESFSEPESESSVGLGYYEVKMSDTMWYINGETREVYDVIIMNADENMYDMYFDLVLVPTEEKLYTSPVIKIGDYLDNVVLDDTSLEPGEYTCVMVHHLLDPSTNQEIDGLELYVDIEIL